MYNDLMARERRTLHREIAEAIERVYERSPDARLGDLAYHYYEAQAWEQALGYAKRAGDSASALHSPRAATEQYTRAMEAALKLGQTPPLELLRARARAYELLGNFEGARDDYTVIVEAARAAGDTHIEWQAELDLGWLWTVRDYVRGEGNILPMPWISRGSWATRQCWRTPSIARVTGTPILSTHSMREMPIRKR